MAACKAVGGAIGGAAGYYGGTAAGGVVGGAAAGAGCTLLAPGVGTVGCGAAGAAAGGAVGGRAGAAGGIWAGSKIGGAIGSMMCSSTASEQCKKQADDDYHADMTECGAYNKSVGSKTYIACARRASARYADALRACEGK
jgi:hypothetical protein